MQTHRVHVAVLSRLGNAAGQVRSQPAIVERLNRKLVIWDNAAINLLVQFTKLLDDLGASAIRYFLANTVAVLVISERDRPATGPHPCRSRWPGSGPGHEGEQPLAGH
jgi:hypothetical protein